jgi:5'-nucleotidase
MTLLLTNDDGIDSESLMALAARLRKEHDVWVVAPATQMSACSHSITLNGAIKTRKKGEQDFACWGTPADCVMISFLGFLPRVPDMIISGINWGPNIGTDIIYSGTAAGARQGAFLGKPSVAASMYSYAPPFHYGYAVEFIARNLDIFRQNWSPDHFLNINFPNLKGEKPGVAVTFPSRRIYNDTLETYNGPDGCQYNFFGGEYPVSIPEKDSDHDVLERGKISISPVFLHPQNHDSWEKYHDLTFRR